MPDKEFFYEQYPLGINKTTIYDNWIDKYVKNRTGIDYSEDFNYLDEVTKSDGKGLCEFINNTLQMLNQSGVKRNYSFSPGCIIGMNDTYITQFNALYDAYVKQTDSHIKKILDYYDNNLSNNTILIITADHGEMIGEHDVIGHGLLYYYYDAIHVPLIIRIPGASQKVINRTISLIDITPTIFKLINYRTYHDMRGVSVFKDEEITKFAFRSVLKNIRSSDISGINEGYQYADGQIYNLRKNQENTDNIPYAYNNKLKDRLNDEVNTILSEKKENTTEITDTELENKLRSLGYIK
jgi:arylsulfatase A-like enzyme